MATLFGRLVDAFADVVAPLFGRGRGVRIVAVEGAEGLAVYRVARGRATALAHDAPLAAHGGPVEMRLAAERVLTRTVRLPAEGRDYFEAILRHRLDRLTPWEPASVVFGFAPAAAVDGDGQVPVAFAATSAAIAADAEAKLAARGLRPTALGIAGDGPEAPLGIDLYRGERAPRRTAFRRRVGLAAALTLALTGMAAGGTAWLRHQEEAALAAVDADLARLRRALVARAADAGASRSERLLAEAVPERSAAVLLDGLADALDDGTYLTALEITPRTVRLAGVSTDAPGLIPALEGSALLDGVRFGAPVVRTEDGADSFDIEASRTKAATP
ncbi:PilN domain-containing protein [Acuticoccus sp. I52.16.1]|uniref:PilN domain-containing protein n=1 Tax=Acuticoccus sp. I52.16.1 TaxID=2928472 RepID=UPI001FD31625|nr:PilN domain-containing protein [Acuticoccus sp. I52.16.1]UOM34668.1 PilN domain-containing protein [Acuticoccus sp. I52.16.1]